MTTFLKSYVDNLKKNNWLSKTQIVTTKKNQYSDGSNSEHFKQKTTWHIDNRWDV